MLLTMDNLYPRWYAELVARGKLTPPHKAQSGSQYLTIFGLIVTSLLFIFLLWDWFSIGVLIDQDKITQYIIGGSISSTEPQAAADYAHSSLVIALGFLLPALILLSIATAKSTSFFRWLAFAFIIVEVIISRTLISGV